jgi:hypothetical protein
MAMHPSDAMPDQELAPNFFIIGAARSGTTMLAEMLRQHPGIFITQPKEVHFLAFANQLVSFKGPGDDVMINRSAVTDIETYRTLFDSVRGESARGDASVSSLYFPQQTLASLRDNFPGARLVVVLRDPMSRAFSAFSYLKVRGFEPRSEFLEALREEPSRIHQGWHYLWHYVGMGMYGDQLKPFLDELGPSRLKVLFYENLARDPHGSAQEIFEFLGVDQNRKVIVRQVNASGNPKSSLAHLALRWATGEPRLKRAVKAVVPFRARERIRLANLEKVDVPEEAKEFLREAFEADSVVLSSLLREYYPGMVESAPTWVKDGPGARR